MIHYEAAADKELLLLLKNGDKAAFTELYNRYWEKMVITAFLKLKSRPDAEEVVQDLFVDLWNRRRHLDVQGNLYTYLGGAIKFKIYTHLARRQQEQEKVRLLYPDEQCRNTEEWLDYEALREDLEKAVLKLPERSRLVFRMSREAGFSNKQIAQSLQVSLKAIEKHMTKALSHLQTALKNIPIIFF